MPFDIRREIGVPDRGDEQKYVTRGMVSGSIGRGVRPRERILGVCDEPHSPIASPGRSADLTVARRDERR